MNNYAFIDGTNLHMTFEHLEWRLDYHKLRIHLKDTYSISKAYYFIGYNKHFAYMYLGLERDGYEMMYKPISFIEGGKIKGNCDTELTLQAVLDKPNYDKAVIITSDGDFSCLVKHLIACDKLYRVISPCLKGCSHLLKEAAGVKIDFLDKVRDKLEYK